MRPMIAIVQTPRLTRLSIALLVATSAILHSTASEAQTVRRNPLRPPVTNHAANRAVSGSQAGRHHATQASYAQVQPAPEMVYSDDLGCDDGSCGEIACDSGYCDSSGCSPGWCLPELWGGLEFLAWWEREASLPPLVTSSPVGTDRNDAGILGEPTTAVLFGGDQPLTDDPWAGIRLTLGTWLDAGRCNGVGARAFGMERHSNLFAANNQDVPVLARPFFNAFTGEEDALLVGFPDEINGGVQVQLKSETQGAQVFGRHLVQTGCNYRIDFIGGYRYVSFDETLQVNNLLAFSDPASLAFGTRIDQSDRFDMSNDFHGGEIGFMGHSVDGRWSMDFMATIAFGATRQRAAISGGSITTPSVGNPIELQGGLLTQQSNIGVYEDNPFAVVPEGTLQVGYFLTPRLDLSIGYTFLYVSKVARAGSAVDRAVNLTQQTGELDGPARPEFQFASSGYWLQGLNLGLNLRF